MAEEDDGQEKTEDATARRLEKAREEGQIARSRELNTAAILLAGAGGLLVFGSRIATDMERIFRACFALPPEAAADPALMTAYLASATRDGVASLFPLFSVLLIAAFVGPVALGGWLFSGKAIMPKLSRMDPLKGLQRMFSRTALVELVKSVAKVVLVGSVAIMVLASQRDDLVTMAHEAVMPAMGHSLSVVGWSLLFLSAATVLIAAVDVPFQLWDFSQKMKMTKQQVREEMKDSEGKPEVKGRIRQLQRDMARKRMMAAVPQADVVITNPTHFAVALKYDINGQGAPVLLAKGSDLVAQAIREIATANKVPIVTSPALARAVFYTTELDQEIPQRLYVAVAKVLAYVFQLKTYRPGSGRRPAPPGEADVPADLRFDDRVG